MTQIPAAETEGDKPVRSMCKQSSTDPGPHGITRKSSAPDAGMIKNRKHIPGALHKSVSRRYGHKGAVPVSQRIRQNAPEACFSQLTDNPSLDV